jgi:hypothetical protein
MFHFISKNISDKTPWNREEKTVPRKIILFVRFNGIVVFA